MMKAAAGWYETTTFHHPPPRAATVAASHYRTLTKAAATVAAANCCARMCGTFRMVRGGLAIVRQHLLAVDFASDERNLVWAVWPLVTRCVGGTGATSTPCYAISSRNQDVVVDRGFVNRYTASFELLDLSVYNFYGFFNKVEFVVELDFLQRNNEGVIGQTFL
ncbi:hypothetical protein Tco_0491643 [Tanacetum coccineum]